MKLLARGLLALVLSGCARGTLAVLVPRLDLRLALSRTHDSSGVPHAAERTHLTLGAMLHFRPTWPARGATSTAALVAPCETDDAPCLADLFAAEPELAGLLEAP